MRKKLISLGIIFILMILSFSGCVQDEPNIFYVDINGEGDFISIQDAINSSSDKDTIIVREGTYNELIVINKSVNIKGTNTETTIISHKNRSRGIIVKIDAEYCSFNGFTINGPGYSSEVNGIDVNTSNNTISNNVITNTKNGIYLNELSKDNKIFGNIIKNNKYGISTRKSDNNNISENEISNNDLYGIYLSVSNNYVISENRISDSNTGIRIKGSDGSIVYNNTISNCDGGLLCCCGSGNNKIYLNNFEENVDYNGRDDIFNQWDNGEKGNYWDDYIKLNPNATSTDGIWDTPYNITSPYSNETKVDRYPLVNPI